MDHTPSRRLRAALAWLLCLAVCAGPAPADDAAARPPRARKVPRSYTLHGDTIRDDYYWLREKANPEVLAYLEAENAYTAAVLKPTAKLREALYQEMLARIKQTDLSVPYRLGDYLYYARTEEGKQYPVRCRKRGPDGPEQVLLDLNELARGQKYLGLGAFAVSDDDQLLAYATDVTGFREYTLHVKDLRSGRLLPDRVPRVHSLAWAADNRTLFYVTDDAAKRPYRLYRHVLGAPKGELIWEEKDELYRVRVSRSRDRKYLFGMLSSLTTDEVRCLPADRPAGDWRVVLPRTPGVRCDIEHRDGRFYLTTDKDAKNFRLVTAPADDPRPEQWKELVGHRPDVLIEDVQVFARHAVVAERAGGLPRLRVLDLANGQAHLVELPEAVCSVLPDANPEFATPTFRFHFQSLVTPASVFDYGLDTRQRTLLKQTEVLGGYDRSRYATERLRATAADGTRVPISLVYRKGVPLDGTSPLLLYGYGAYGASLPLNFDAQRLSLLDRGVIYALAHVRGGREMGEAWHEQGKLSNKRNTFTDFIACADHLVSRKYTSRGRLAVRGGSAGGLLIAAVLNLRPDLCRAAVLDVPFVDAVNTMLDPTVPLTAPEFLEWGNPAVKAEYDYMKAYCPYTNLAARAYPAVLVRTALNDSQVMYWEPAKYVAKLRALKTDKNPLLLHVNMAAGHGGASGRYDALRETALVYAFLLDQLGVRP